MNKNMYYQCEACHPLIHVAFRAIEIYFASQYRKVCMCISIAMETVYRYFGKCFFFALCCDGDDVHPYKDTRSIWPFYVWGEKKGIQVY